MVGERPSRLAALAGVLLLAGCGAGGRDESERVRLTVTDASGSRTVVEREIALGSGTATSLSVLEAGAQAQVAGGDVGAVEGLEGTWTPFVNGVRVGTAEKVRPGDRVWWSRGEDAPPAVVGSFPEPFLHGIDGERLPTRIECERSAGDACDVVQEKLKKLGIVAGKALPGTASGTDVLRVVVGLWPDLRDDTALRQIERGPEVSGVFGRFDARGERFLTLDARGGPGPLLGPGTGVVAAARLRSDPQARPREDPPVWAVTGTDAAGLKAAADAFDETVLNEKFALAISDGLPVPLPAIER